MERLRESVRSLLLFTLFGCCGSTFLISLQSRMTRFWKTWERRLSKKEEARSYFAAEWQKILVVLIWVCLNIALFIEAAVRWYKRVDGLITLNKDLPGWGSYTPVWVMIARGFGQLLNLNCALIILVPMRTLSNILRSLRVGAVIPIDKNIIFHRYLAYWIAVCTVGHTFAHYMNYSCCHLMYVNRKGISETSSWRAAWVNKFGLTGNLLSMMMIAMYAASTAAYRRSKNFTVFWYVHHLYVLFFCGLLIHGKQFWMWFMGPLCIYIVERILRIFRGSTETIVKKVHGLPSNVIHLELDKPGFVYQAGQYCFLNCPLISKHEWHPITISSAPEEENISFHIRVVGDWTSALKNLFIPSGKGVVVINKPKTPDGRDHLIRVDGPFGTAAEYVFDYEYIMLIAAGIGVTPYVSLLKHLRNRIATNTPTKMKKCFFYWINRDKSSWEWFSDLLDDIEQNYSDHFQINTFMTGILSAAEVQQIMSSTIAAKSSSSSSGPSYARVLYDYDPGASDEIQLQAGDKIKVLEQDESGWWRGTNLKSEETGLFPANHVNLIEQRVSSSPNKKYGRPNWAEEFQSVRTSLQAIQPNISVNNRAKVGIFVCGPPLLTKQLYQTSVDESKNSIVQFQFHKENF